MWACFLLHAEISAWLCMKILWRACCRQYGMCWQPLLWQRKNTQQWKRPAFSVWSVPRQQWGSRVLFAVCFVGVFSLWSVHGLYSSDVSRQSGQLRGQFQLRVYRVGVSGESSAEELVDGQWEPVGSAGGPGFWRNSAGVVTQLWESVVILRRLGKYYSELWSCKSVCTVIVCNCVWSNKSSCQSNTRLI
jgi:hypothetical protein